jgi:hypothetical protein
MLATDISISRLDMLVQWERSNRDQAGFYSGIDLAARTVRVMGSGIWRQSDADRYFDHQQRMIDEARRRYGPLRVSFDVREWIVEDERSALQFQTMNMEIYRPEDRLVALVSSSINKEHPRVALAVGTREAFLSPKAAETWLQAYAI